MDRFLQGSRFSLFTLIHLADKETYRLIGYAVYLLSYSADRDNRFPGNRGVVKAYNIIVVGQPAVFTDD